MNFEVLKILHLNMDYCEFALCDDAKGFSSLPGDKFLGMYRISGSYPAIRPIFHYPVSGLLLNYPVSCRISCWYPAGYRIIALLAATSSSSYCCSWEGS